MALQFPSRTIGGLLFTCLFCFALILQGGCGGTLPDSTSTQPTASVQPSVAAQPAAPVSLLTPAEQELADRMLARAGRNVIPIYLAPLRRQPFPDEELILRVLRYFVSQGADVNAVYGEIGSTTLHSAVWLRSAEIVKFLVSKGANVHTKNAFGVTPLHNAVEIGSIDIVKFLVSQGADVNTTGLNDWTPLHLALRHDLNEIAEFLVFNGADVNARTHGNTLLHNAVQNARQSGSVNIVKFLVSNGADVNAANLAYWTPLHFAARDGLLEIVEFLVSNGANVNVTDERGGTPLSLARSNNHAAVANFLTSRGAR